MKYLVEDATNPTQLYTYTQQEGMSVVGSEMFDKVEINNVEVSISDLDTANGTYQLSVGEHTVKYTLKDPTLMGVKVTEQSYVYGAAFAQCISVSEVIIPNSVITIGQSAFVFCCGLKRVTIGSSVTYIGKDAFNGCTGLTSITIGNSVTTISDFAFEGCTGLTSITIPNGVTTIGYGAFSGCTGLTSVTIPNGVITISDYAFEDCSSLTSITSLATTAPTIEDTTFYNVNTGGTLYVPKGSTGYDVWMGAGLSTHNWTLVEQ